MREAVSEEESPCSSGEEELGKAPEGEGWAGEEMD